MENVLAAVFAAGGAVAEAKFGVPAEEVGDVGAILGWGFAPWSGGPLSWLDMIGAPYAAERCDQLTEKFGERFTCPELLREMAQKNQSFYGRFNPDASKAA